MTRSEDLPLALLLPPHKIYSGAGLGSAALSHTGLHLLVVAELLPNDAETRGGLNTRRVLPTGTESSRQRPRAAASPQLLWVAETPARLVADCFLRLGELAHALADYQQALELSPGNLGVQRRVAAALHELGRRDVVAR